MRPGPGLVVMALAFISGARRGTTSEQSTSTKVVVNKLGSTNSEERTAGFLAQINPWLSACDVAQPQTAPDLQGQCIDSGSILPKNWVNEGPGPPECPISCSELSKTNKQQNFNTITENNKMKMEERNRFYEKQQCLEYLGDIRANSPDYICKKSPAEISTKLHTLRLRHCCERNAYSALHNEGLTAVKNGGKLCEQTLNNLIETDTLAGRITCEWNEILFRYDCRQVYSMKHGCNDCKEAYRRWICSTLIPYFAEPSDIRQNSTLNKNQTKTNDIKNSTLVDGNKNTQVGLVSDSVEDPIVSRILNRSKRKSEIMHRKRIRPCLRVCQTVEEQCPYMLPGDRAPGYNTQYAGEPTFLCMDPNIPETGEQLIKSNNGPESCCYQYCDPYAVYNGICPHCNFTDLEKNQDVKRSELNADLTKTVYDSSVTEVDIPPQECQLVPGLSLTSSRCEIPYYASSASSSSLSSSSTLYFSLKNTNASSILNKRVNFLWTISWILLILIKTNIAAWTYTFSAQLSGS